MPSKPQNFENKTEKKKKIMSLRGTLNSGVSILLKKD